ncbi:hypothetical protein MNB_SUP05-SYMBIONT-5-364 [hydrothermal vent metagenome]|uniref:TIGR03749 family integrating conjugative element protein n=1 Tax=hydrothermal vent metagenome TaxID=652676 RepID=A0A1W1E5T0_9ZZZZ
MIKLLLSAFMLWVLLVPNANAELRLLNHFGDPIPLELSVGQEIQLNFENPLGSIGIPEAIKSKLKKQLIDTRLWIKATKTFKPTRVLIKNAKGGISVFLLSATTRKQKVTQHPIKYNVINEKRQLNEVSPVKNANPELSYVDLTRFVAQSLYSPKRLIKKIKVIRVVIDTKKTVPLFICSETLACNDTVSARPIAAWKSSRYYISAILLKNTSKQQVVLDPRDLIGEWKSATFHFNRLGQAGSPTDTSVVYLISLSPFEQSL